jgi:hypothetical protein
MMDCHQQTLQLEMVFAVTLKCWRLEEERKMAKTAPSLEQDLEIPSVA